MVAKLVSIPGQCKQNAINKVHVRLSYHPNLGGRDGGDRDGGRGRMGVGMAEWVTTSSSQLKVLMFKPHQSRNFLRLFKSGCIIMQEVLRYTCMLHTADT